MTTGQLYVSLRHFFSEYATSFLSFDDDISENTLLKRDHTFRVCTIADKISSAAALYGDERDLALLTALLHDLGRFEQYAAYRTFSDAHSENHSEIALRLIEQRGLLDPLPADCRAVVCDAIAFHNRQSVPENIDDRTALHSRIIRDADKLDIVPLSLDYYATRLVRRNPAMEGKLPDTPGYSAEVVDLILASKTVSNGIRRNYNDMKLVQLAWLLDLNFPFSFRYVEENHFVERLLAFLPDDKTIRAVGEYVLKAIREKAGTAVFTESKG